jgi:hypothetical protein
MPYSAVLREKSLITGSTSTAEQQQQQQQQQEDSKR